MSAAYDSVPIFQAVLGSRLTDRRRILDRLIAQLDQSSGWKLRLLSLT